MGDQFEVAMDWETARRRPDPGLPWLTRRVAAGGFSRFRCPRAGIELYVDSDGMVELRDINAPGKVLYRRLGPNDPAGRQL